MILHKGKTVTAILIRIRSCTAEIFLQTNPLPFTDFSAFCDLKDELTVNYYNIALVTY